MRQLARKSALNARAADGLLLVVERLEFETPKTKQMTALLDKLGFEGRKVLVLTHGINRAAYLSARNLPRAGVLPYADASAYDILWADAVVVEEGALSGEAAAAEPAEAAKAPKAAKPKAAGSRQGPRPRRPAAPKAKAAKKPAAEEAARGQEGRAEEEERQRIDARPA